jgi:hypothetical protein
MLEDPLRHSRFFWIEFEEQLLAPLKDQTLVEIRHKNGRLAIEHLSNMLHGQLCEGGQPTVGGQLTAQCIEDRGTPFLMTSQLSLLLGTDSQSADRKGND